VTGCLAAHSTCEAATAGRARTVDAAGATASPVDGILITSSRPDLRLVA
jgi:hypothetical protein